MMAGSVEAAMDAHEREGFSCVLLVNVDGSWCWRIWDRSFSGEFGDVSLQEAVLSWLIAYKDMEAYIAGRAAG